MGDARNDTGTQPRLPSTNHQSFNPYNPSNPGSDNRVGQGYNGEIVRPHPGLPLMTRMGAPPFLFPVGRKGVALVVGGLPPATVACC